MKEKFTLKHVTNVKGNVMTFSPFGEGNRKAMVIAIRFKEFMENHVSMTQYEEILKQFSKDLEIKENKIVIKIR